LLGQVEEARADARQIRADLQVRVGEVASLSQRSMQLQVTVQDAQVWIGNGAATVEITPLRLR
jgi:uncharacterized protein YaeQ